MFKKKYSLFDFLMLFGCWMYGVGIGYFSTAWWHYIVAIVALVPFLFVLAAMSAYRNYLLLSSV